MIGTLAWVSAFVALFASAAHANAIVNGDFEDQTLLQINSDYLHTPGGNAVEGSWWVNPWDSGGPWDSSQHTLGGVAAMSVNGDDSNQAGIKRVWYQTVPVVAGQTYEFSTWALGTASGFQGFSLKFAFDGVQVGSIFSPSATRIWEQFSTSYIATGPTVEISIVNVSGITFPNDFMLDDISLTQIPEPSAAILIALGLAGMNLIRRRGSDRTIQLGS